MTLHLEVFAQCMQLVLLRQTRLRACWGWGETASIFLQAVGGKIAFLECGKS